MNASEVKHRNRFRENVTVTFAELPKDHMGLVCPECEKGHLGITFDDAGTPMPSSCCDYCNQSYTIEGLPLRATGTIIVNLTNEALHGILFEKLVQAGHIPGDKHFATSVVFRMDHNTNEIVGLSFYAKPTDKPEDSEEAPNG